MLKTLSHAIPFVIAAGVALAGGETTTATTTSTATTTTTTTNTADEEFDLGKIGELMEAGIDEEAAEKIFRKSCRGCHGNKGQGASSYPNIADLEPEYLAHKLIRYRDGEKFGPNSVLMIQQAKKLSDEDIANLAVYVTTAFD